MYRFHRQTRAYELNAQKRYDSQVIKKPMENANIRFYLIPRVLIVTGLCVQIVGLQFKPRHTTLP